MISTKTETIKSILGILIQHKRIKTIHLLHYKKMIKRNKEYKNYLKRLKHWLRHTRDKLLKFKLQRKRMLKYMNKTVGPQFQRNKMLRILLPLKKKKTFFRLLMKMPKTWTLNKLVKGKQFIAWKLCQLIKD